MPFSLLKAQQKTLDFLGNDESHRKFRTSKNDIVFKSSECF